MSRRSLEVEEHYVPTDPCPFCGVENANFVKDGNPAPTPHVTLDERLQIRYVECENCGANGPVVPANPFGWENAWRLWNTRK